MRRALLLTLSLSVISAATTPAATFAPTRIAPDWGLDALTRGVSRQQVGRDLFSDPYATVTLGSTDVYSVFPYVETRTFQIVSDPQWNRLVFGEMGRTLRAYDGQGQTFGALSNPRGMSVDEANRVYIADTGNNRVLVLQASTEFGEIALKPVFEVKGLSGPYDVSYSDGGTPFVSGDDWMYVADTGKSRVMAYALEPTGARLVCTIGDLGSGVGHFAGPMALTAGRSEGASTMDVFVADAHTQRIVQLHNTGTSLQWVADAKSDADVITSLDADQWGNLYAAAPNRGVIKKFGADMAPLAELRGDLARPRSFRVPFFTVRDHRDNTVTRSGRPVAVSLEQWGDASGVRQWNLGVDVADLAVTEGKTPAARFTLTDPAQVSLDFVDAQTGASLLHRSAGTLSAGAHSVAISEGDLAAAAGSGDVILKITAASRYAGGPTATASTAFRVSGGSAALPAMALLIGGTPNPIVASTRIAFVLPQAGAANASLKLYDSAGRVVRRFNEAFTPGRNEVVWDGAGERGARMAPGVYFVRLRDRDRELTQRLVLVR